MTFVALPPSLHSTAAAAEKYFRTRGATSIRHEVAIRPELDLRPTLSGKLPDGTILCVDVATKPYNGTLDSFVVEALKGAWPIHLYVAMPDDSDVDLGRNLKKAKERGIGVISLQGGNAWHLYHGAVSLDLFGLTPTALGDYPRARRPAVVLAEETFKSGDPNKGCQAIFVEIEAISRSCAIATQKAGFWRTPGPGEAKPPKNMLHDPWARVLDSMMTLLEFNKIVPACPQLKPVVAATMAATDPRNQTSHKPKNNGELRTRNRKLREWFEQGRELLARWYKAVAPLKI